MATKKVLVSLLELRKRCPPKQLPQLARFQQRYQLHKNRVDTLKTGMPNIDWDYYKTHVRADSVGLVESFEKQYKSYAIPYPENKYSKKLETLTARVTKKVARFVRKSNRRIAAYQKQIEYLKAVMPYKDMTWEDYCILFPKRAPDFINRPTFWPHNPSEQIGHIVLPIFPRKRKSKKKRKSSRRRRQKQADPKKAGEKKAAEKKGDTKKEDPKKPKK